jgi:glycosyltransferase involved in cell wall biosynthesis
MTNGRKKINVLHLISTNFVGGPEKQILSHLEYVDRKRFNIHFGSFIEGRQPNEFLRSAKAIGAPNLVLTQNHFLDFTPINKLRTYVLANDIHGLITHGYKSNIFGNLALIGLPISHAMYVRGWTSEDKKVMVYNWLDKKFLKRGDLVVTVAHRKLIELESLGISKKKLRCIFNGVSLLPLETPPQSLREAFGIPPESGVALAAGRLSPEKGHALLLKAVGQVLSQGVDFHCVIFGDGPERDYLENQRTQLGLSSNVIFAGFSRTWKNYLPQADFLINPSLSEVMPNVVLESMAQGCPVLATDVGGVTELIPDDDHGLVVRSGSPEALATGIVASIKNKPKRVDIVEKAKAHILGHFSFQAQAKYLEDLYLELYSLNPRI